MILADETIKAAYVQNFPMAGTSIPINTMGETVDGQDSLSGEANFAIADGSMHFLSKNFVYELFIRMGTRAGGEVVSFPAS
jgi:hypothetical protein